MRLPIQPDQSGYALTEGKEVLSVALAGGPSRYRRDTIGASNRLQVSWILDPDEFEELRSFYKSTRYNNAAWFDADLLIDQPYISSYKASFIPGSFQLKSQRGLTYEVSAELEIQADAINNNAWINPTLNKLNIPLQQGGFLSKDYEEVISTTLDGGRGIYRRGPASPLMHVTAKWALDQIDYYYLRNFYRSITINGAFPFLIDIIYDSGSLVECLAYFIPGTFKLNEIDGLRYVVDAELEVYRKKTSELIEILITTFDEMYGSQDNTLVIFDLLNQINNTWPLAV